MPTYEYRCGSCGAEFEKFQKITAKPVARCPDCGEKAERLLSAGAGLVFKGSGFYITDYKRAGEKRKDSEGSSGEKADKPKTSGSAPSDSSAAGKPDSRKKDR